MGTPKRSTSHYGSASGFRITAQFIQGETDVHLWSGTFDRELHSASKLHQRPAARTGFSSEGSPSRMPP